MGVLDSYITVNIDRQTKSPSQAGFGTPLLIGYHSAWADRVKTYSTLSALTDDGFTTSDPIYLMAQDLLAQSIAPPQFKVGRRALAYTKSYELTPADTTEGLVYSVSITTVTGGTATVDTATYTVQNGDAVADIIDGLHADLGTPDGAITATDSTTTWDIEADNAGDMVYIHSYNVGLEVEDVTADPGIATDMAAILLADGDWYGCALDSNSHAEIDAMAAWVETAEKIFFAQTQDSEVLDSGTSDDVASGLQDNAYERTLLFFHRNDNDYIAPAALGKWLPKNPGSTQLAYKTLASISVDTLTTTDQTQILGKGANYYVRLAGINVTFNGRTPSGEWVDTMRGSDWLKARIQERIYGVLANNDKIPYTEAGMQLIKAEILAQLQTGVNRGFIASSPEPTVTLPAIGSISAADKNNRLLQDVTFQATLAGAIIKTIINGTLSV